MLFCCLIPSALTPKSGLHELPIYVTSEFLGFPFLVA